MVQEKKAVQSRCRGMPFQAGEVSSAMSRRQGTSSVLSKAQKEGLRVGELSVWS